jgi:3-phenylpropionate/cinnamic acid dioxygenase small subunit
MRVWVALPKKAALYTMKTSQEQRLTQEPAALARTGRQPH